MNCLPNHYTMASPHRGNETEKTHPLIEAAKANDFEKVKELLDQGENVNVKDEAYYGQTAISWAAELGLLEVFKLLYEHGARLDILDVDGNSPVFWAMNKEYVNVIEYLLDNIKEEDISHKYCAGRSMLFVATEYGSAENVKRFVSSDSNVRDDDGLTPLMFAALYSRNAVSNAAALLEAGADPLLEDYEGRTAIYYACQRGKAELAKLLLDRVDGSFDVDGRGPEARPLIEAAKQGDVTMTQLLLERGPQLEFPDEQGKTPLYWAAKNGHIENICALIDAGADPYRLCRPPVPNGDWNLTAFAIAATNCEEKRHDFIHQDLKPDLTIRNDERGATAFHLAAYFGVEPAALQRMIAAGCSVDTPDMDGRTPLLLASERGHSSIVAILL